MYVDAVLFRGSSYGFARGNYFTTMWDNSLRSIQLPHTY